MAEDSHSIDGFYSAYFTGVTGSSIGIFLFKGGIVVGADAGGGKYDGTYIVDSGTQDINASITFTMPVGSNLITGITSEAEPLSIDVPLRLPKDFNRHDVHRIETPIGPINAKFDKIRSA